MIPQFLHKKSKFILTPQTALMDIMRNQCGPMVSKGEDIAGELRRSPSRRRLGIFTVSKSNQIFITVYSPYYAETCNELPGPSPRLSAWAAQLRRNVAAVASRWRHCADLTGPGIEPETFRTDSVRLATELTAGPLFFTVSTQKIRYLQQIRLP